MTPQYEQRHVLTVEGEINYSYVCHQQQNQQYFVCGYSSIFVRVKKHFKLSESSMQMYAIRYMNDIIEFQPWVDAVIASIVIKVCTEVMSGKK